MPGLFVIYFYWPVGAGRFILQFCIQMPHLSYTPLFLFLTTLFLLCLFLTTLSFFLYLSHPCFSLFLYFLYFSHHSLVFFLSFFLFLASLSLFSVSFLPLSRFLFFYLPSHSCFYLILLPSPSIFLSPLFLFFSFVSLCSYLYFLSLIYLSIILSVSLGVALKLIRK